MDDLMYTSVCTACTDLVQLVQWTEWTRALSSVAEHSGIKNTIVDAILKIENVLRYNHNRRIKKKLGIKNKDLNLSEIGYIRIHGFW